MAESAFLIGCLLVCFAHGADPKPPEWLSKLPVKFRTQGETRSVVSYIYDGGHYCANESDPFSAHGECINKDDANFSKDGRNGGWEGDRGPCGVCLGPVDDTRYTLFCAENPENNTFSVQFVEYNDKECQDPMDKETHYPPTKIVNLLLECEGDLKCEGYCDGDPPEPYEPNCQYIGINDKQLCLSSECHWYPLPRTMQFRATYHAIEETMLSVV